MIRWSKVDGVLPVDHVTHDGTLIINRVSADDAGVYECIATDAYKTARSRMELFIIGLLYGRPLRQAIIFSCCIFYWFTASDHYFRSVCLSVFLFVCLFVQSFFQPSSIRFGSN